MAYQDYRQESRKQWGTNSDGYPDQQHLKTGSLLRIADACELMAKDRAAMESRMKWLEGRDERNTRTLNRLLRANAALRGCLRRAKKGRK